MLQLTEKVKQLQSKLTQYEAAGGAGAPPPVGVTLAGAALAAAPAAAPDPILLSCRFGPCEVNLTASSAKAMGAKDILATYQTAVRQLSVLLQALDASGGADAASAAAAETVAMDLVRRCRGSRRCWVIACCVNRSSFRRCAVLGAWCLRTGAAHWCYAAAPQQLSVLAFRRPAGRRVTASHTRLQPSTQQTGASAERPPAVAPPAPQFKYTCLLMYHNPAELRKLSAIARGGLQGEAQAVQLWRSVLHMSGERRALPPARRLH